MIYNRLIIHNILGCDISMELSDGLNVVVGDNRSGKTLIPRAIALALFGLSAPKQLDKSWKMRSSEIVSHGFYHGYVDLTVTNNGRTYNIHRVFGDAPSSLIRVYDGNDWAVLATKVSDILEIVETELNMTPALYNIVSSNEECMINQIAIDSDMQEESWKGWAYSVEIITDNLKRSARKCTDELKRVGETLSNNKADKDILINNVLGRQLATTENISSRIQAIVSEMAELDTYIDALNNYDIFTASGAAKFVAGERTHRFQDYVAKYVDLLGEIEKNGGVDSIVEKLRIVNDEIEKLKLSNVDLPESFIRTDARIYKTDHGVYVELMDDCITHTELLSAQVIAEYDDQYYRGNVRKAEILSDLKDSYQVYVGEYTDRKTREIKKSYERLSELKADEEILLTAERDLIALNEQITTNQETVDKLEHNRDRFLAIYDNIDITAIMEDVRVNTVQLINNIFSMFEWNIKAVRNGDGIVIESDDGDIRTHASGAETSTFGLSWRMSVANAFSLPLILDEVAALFDVDNYAILKNVLTRRIQTQSIVLSLDEELLITADKGFSIERDSITTITEV